MKDEELTRILKGAPVPERTPEYWEQFPNRVLAQIHSRSPEAPVSQPAASRAGRHPVSSETGATPWRFLSPKAAFALVLGLVALCLGLGFTLGFWKGRHLATDEAQLADARTYFNEIEPLFPGQLRAIVFDQQGTHLVLSERPDVPPSPPLYIEITGPKGCQRFVTFSGQQIRVNGDVCEVLQDRQGHILLVGRHLLWSGASPTTKSGPYQIEARPLETTS